MPSSIGLRLAILIVVVLLLSALISPPVFLFIQSAFPQLIWPYSRVYDRILLLVAVIVVYLMRRSFFVKGEKINIYLKSATPYLRILAGILVTLLPVLLIFPWLADDKIFTAVPIEYEKFTPRVFKLLPTMLIVGVIEEFAFRYFLFLQFRKTMNFYQAALISSFIYAIVHFVTPVKTFQIHDYSIVAGFEYYLQVFAQLANFDLFVQLGIIFAVGFMLALVLEKTRSITLCIGLHAGWIAGIKLAKFTHDLKIEIPAAAKRYALLESPLAWVAVGLSFMLILLIVKYVKFKHQEISSRNEKLILLATANAGKVDEMRLNFSHPGVRFITLTEAEKLIGMSAPEVPETGKDYLENCLIKARAYNKWSKLPVISDDTGLEVKALNNAPGIMSARYAGEKATAEMRNAKLIKDLQGQTGREARFICELVFLKSADDFVSARGELNGSISEAMQGRGGFGYDSIFIVSETGKTLAEIKEAEPCFKTHRKIALQILNNTGLFKSFIESN